MDLVSREAWQRRGGYVGGGEGRGNQVKEEGETQEAGPAGIC